MKHRAALTLLACVGGLAPLMCAQRAWAQPSLLSISGVRIQGVSTTGGVYFGTGSKVAPCDFETFGVRLTVGPTIGVSSFGPIGVNASSSDGTTAIGTMPNGTTIALDPPNDSADIPARWTLGGAWTASPALHFPAVTTPAPVQQGDCGSALTAYGVSATGRYAVGGGWLQGGPSFCGGSPGGCWGFSAFIFDYATSTFTDLGNPATVVPPSGSCATTLYTAGASTRANAVSADGTVVVGFDSESNGPRMPAIWRLEGGVWQKVVVSNEAPGQRGGEVFDINDAGTIAVGTAFDHPGQLVKWTTTNHWNTWTMTPLGTPKPSPSWFDDLPWYGGYVVTSIAPTSVSEDGSVVAGLLQYRAPGTTPVNFGFIWTPATVGAANANGPMDVRDYLESLPGVAPLLEKYPVIDNFGTAFVSGDGQTLAGQAGFPVPDAVSYAVRFGSAATVPPAVTLQPCSAEMTSCFTGTSPRLRAGFAGGVDAQWGVRWYKVGAGPGGADLALDEGGSLGGGTFEGTATTTLSINGAGAADAGSYYARAVNGAGSATTSTVSITLGGLVTNASCAAAEPISGPLPASATLNMCGAFGSDGLASCTPNTYTQQWYSFVAPATAEYRISSCGSGFNSVVSVFDGCGGSELACNTSPSVFSICPGPQGVVERVLLTAGHSYRVRVGVVGDFPPFDGSGTLTISLAPPRAGNDECAAAATAALGPNAFDTTEATTGPTLASCNELSGRDVWFAFTPPATGDYRLTTCDDASGSSFDTVLSVHQGSCLGAEIACSDDQGFGQPDQCSEGSQSRIDRLVLAAGTTYYVRVAGAHPGPGAAPSGGPGTLTIIAAPARPANDACASATPVAGPGPVYTAEGVSNAEALEIPDGSSACMNTSARDVWYAFTPATTPAHGWRIQVCGQPWDSVLSIHAGCPGDTSNQLACNNDVGQGVSECAGGASRIDRVALAAGVTYRIRVAGAPSFGRGGGGTLSIFPAPPLPANDACSSPAPAGVGPTPFDLSEATTDDPTFACPGPFAWNEESNRDVWYAFTPTCAGKYSFQVCGSGVDDPMLHLFPTCGAQPLACSDNIGDTATGACFYTHSLIADVPLARNVAVLVRVAAGGNGRPFDATGTLTVTRTGNLACAADFDGANGADLLDIFAFLTAWFGGNPCADFNGANGVDLLDIFAFLSAWFAGC